MAVSRQRSICYALVHNQLHVPDAAAKVSMEVSCDGGIGNLILLVGCIFGVRDVQRVSEDSVLREESSDECVPVREIISTLGALLMTY